MEMKLDKTGLEDRTFEAFSITAKRSYIFLCNMGTNVSRWSADAVEYFNLPGESMYDAGEIWKKYIHPDDLPQYLKNFDAFIIRRQNGRILNTGRRTDLEIMLCVHASVQC